ncbi:hypothetical protein D3C75_859120 [compost metagenome]
MGEKHELRDHNRRIWQHHGAEHQDEQELITSASEAGEPVGDQPRGNQGADDRQHGDDQAVLVEGTELQRIKNIPVVAPRPALRQKGRRELQHLLLRLQRSGDHEE